MARCHFQRLKNHALLSYNRCFYLLKAEQGNTYQILLAKECEGTVHFASFEQEDLLALTDESTKLVHFYPLAATLQSQSFSPTRTQ